jgi:hypothetical protein
MTSRRIYLDPAVFAGMVIVALEDGAKYPIFEPTGWQ